MRAAHTKKIWLTIIVAIALVVLFLVTRFSNSGGDSARAQLLRFVPADTTSVVFVDLDQLRNSPFLRTLYAWTPHPVEDPDYAQFVTDTGFNYERDLAQILIVFSRHGATSNTFVLAEGKFDRKKIEAYLSRGSAPTLQEKLKVFRFPANWGGKHVAFAFLSDHRMVIADSENPAAALSTATREAHAEWQTHFDRLSGSPLFAVIRQDPTIQTVLAGRSPQLATLIGQLPWITLAGKPDGDLLRVVAEGESSSDVMASQLSDFLQGMQLLAQNGLNDPQLRQQMNPDERDAYLELLKGTQIDEIGRGESKSVRVVLPITSQFLRIAKAPIVGIAPDSGTDPPRAVGEKKTQQAKPAKRR